jgi:hypothetical protein
LAFRPRFFAAGLPDDFFFAGFFEGLADLGLAAERLPPEKMLSQFSEYCFVAPTRTTLTFVAPIRVQNRWHEGWRMRDVGKR